jgi:hypothetical protein
MTPRRAWTVRALEPGRSNAERAVEPSNPRQSKEVFVWQSWHCSSGFCPLQARRID